MEVVVTAGATYVQSSSQIVTANKPTPSFLQAGCSSRMPSVEVLKGNFIYFIYFYALLTPIKWRSVTQQKSEQAGH